MHLKANAAARPLFPLPPILIPTFPARQSLPLPRQQPMAPPLPIPPSLQEEAGKRGERSLPSLVPQRLVENTPSRASEAERRAPEASRRPHLPLGGSGVPACRLLRSLGPLLGQRLGPRSRGAGAVGTPAFRAPRGRGMLRPPPPLHSEGSERGRGGASSRRSQDALCVGCGGSAGSLPARVNKRPSDP